MPETIIGLLLLLAILVRSQRDFYIVEQRSVPNKMLAEFIGGHYWYQTTTASLFEKQSQTIRFFDSSFDVIDTKTREPIMNCRFVVFDDIRAAELYFNRCESLYPDFCSIREMNNLWCVNDMAMNMAVKHHMRTRKGSLINQTPNSEIMKREQRFQDFISTSPK